MVVRASGSRAGADLDLEQSELAVGRLARGNEAGAVTVLGGAGLMDSLCEDDTGIG